MKNIFNLSLPWFSDSVEENRSDLELAANRIQEQESISNGLQEHSNLLQDKIEELMHSTTALRQVGTHSQIHMPFIK